MDNTFANMPKFNSIEEVKDFINDPSYTGVVHLVRSNGESSAITMKEFIDKVGIDNAAQFVFDNINKATCVTVDEDRIDDILKKFLKDPNSLTKDEKVILKTLVEGEKNDLQIASKSILTLMTKTFLEFEKDQPEITRYNVMLSILLTFLEGTLALTSDTISMFCNAPVYDEMIKCTTEQIKLPENVNEDILLLSLFHIIGNRFIGNPKNKDLYKHIDFKKFVESLNLDDNFIYGDFDE